jgi:hypothetical protein
MHRPYAKDIERLEWLKLDLMAEELRHIQTAVMARQERRDNLAANPYYYHQIVELIDMARGGDAAAIAELRARN